jgi:hypothetical protein
MSHMDPYVSMCVIYHVQLPDGCRLTPVDLLCYICIHICYICIRETCLHHRRHDSCHRRHVSIIGDMTHVIGDMPDGCRLTPVDLTHFTPLNVRAVSTKMMTHYAHYYIIIIYIYIMYYIYHIQCISYTIYII